MNERKVFDNGVHDISNDDYHSSDGLSRSAIKLIGKSPYHYWYKYLSGFASEHKQTPAMIKGSMVHTMALEPHKFESEFIMKPEKEALPKKVLLKDVGKEQYEIYKDECEAIREHNEISQRIFEQRIFEQQKENKMVVDAKTVSEVSRIVASLKQDDLFNSLVDGAKIEQSIFFTHKPTGIQCKVRPDIWAGSVVSDLKTSNDLNNKLFQSSAYQMGYFLQAGMIHCALESIGIQLEKFIFTCVENSEPYATRNFVLSNEALDFGLNQFDELMQRYAQCLEKNEWPSYDITELHLPGYAQYI